MLPPRSQLFLFLRAALAAGLLAGAASLPAAEGGFTATLSADQQAATGLTSLTAGERTTLDELVTREVAQARAAESDGPGGAFTARCTPEEWARAGLNHLTPSELAKLNELVAAALASHPKPRERPRIKDSDVLNPAMKPEIHGSVSLTFGRGGGGSFHGSAMSLDYFDPAHGFSLNVGLATFSGKGLYGFYPDDFGSPYYYGGFGVLAAPYRTSPYDDFIYGDGTTLRTGNGWDQAGSLRRRP